MTAIGCREVVVKRRILSILLALMLTMTAFASSAMAEESKSVTETRVLDDEQRNSISMLNYLAALSQKVTASKSSRMELEKMYSSIINNTNPNAVDEQTQNQLISLLDAIERYRMVSVKRERLQYVYDQSKAMAIWASIPKTGGVLRAVRSLNWLKLATSVAYMPIDSVASYNAYNAQLDLQYLQDQWALNDDEAETLHTIRKKGFEYRLNIVRDYNLPGEIALSEEAVDEFVKAENNPGAASRIQFLESNRSTYEAFGYYWLVLAKSYFEAGNYKACLDSIETYKKAQTRIFCKDSEYANALTIAISAAKQVLTGKAYTDRVSEYAKALSENTSNSDWASRYFLAETYVELYVQTKDKSFLDKAYEETINNVNSLIREQKDSNKKYLNPIVEQEVPDNATSVQKDDIKAYNKLLKETRATELPPVSEPLLLTCRLLFDIADEKKISDSEKTRIERILRDDGTPLFLNPLLESRFSFVPKAEVIPNVMFDKGKNLKLPAKYVSADAEIKVSVTTGGVTKEYNDWKIDEVDRNNEGDISTFWAEYESETIGDQEYADGSKILVTVMPKKDSGCKAYSAKFKGVVGKKLWILDSVDIVKE